MIVNAKEMLKIQKQMEQKEKNRPIHSDYCLECGCPKEICCERRGRVEELKELHNKMCFKHFDSKSMNPERYSAVKEYVEKRLLKLQEGEKHERYC